MSNQLDRSVQLLADGNVFHRGKKKFITFAVLVLIITLAAVLRFVQLDTLGYANHYYAAAVKSMLQSWHNFFFAAAEPGGSVSVDKPPVGLWMQCISAYFLGVNGFSLLLPQILAGIASVILVYHLVRRSFGSVAGLLAALTLAVTPVAVAVDRNNTIDSSLIFTLLLATWMFIKATETGNLRFLLLGSMFVGIAFNIKMLAAYLPLPAFFALYFLGARETLLRKFLKLVIAGVVVLLVSLSWAVAVDLTPEDQRPYIGSSSDNSEMTLIVGYNGLNRLLGMGRNRLAVFANAPQQNPPVPPVNRPDNNFQTFPVNRPQGNVPPQTNPGQPPSRINPGFGEGGGDNTFSHNRGGRTPSDIGQVGALRLFTHPLNKETSWLLPLGLLGIGLMLAAGKITFPLGIKHQAAVLWGGWLLTGGVFFSIANFFHEYYLALLGAPLAALVGIGLVTLWNLRRQHLRFSVFLTLAAAATTLVFQYSIARSFIESIESIPWLIPTAVVFVIGAIWFIAATFNRIYPVWSKIGLILMIASLYITPSIWAGLTALNPGNNLSLPAAYSGEILRPSNRGDVQVNQSLLTFLEENTSTGSYLMAVPSSMQGADYVLASGRPVLYIGGFNGQDQVITTDELEEMTSSGELRYIYLSGNGAPGGGQSTITSWVQTTCTAVEGYETTTRNAGSPDGTGNGGGAGAQPGNMNISLYDCEK